MWQCMTLNVCLQNSITLNYVLYVLTYSNVCIYIHRIKLTEINEKTSDEGLLVMERTRCMLSIMLFSSMYSYE